MISFRMPLPLCAAMLLLLSTALATDAPTNVQCVANGGYPAGSVTLTFTDNSNDETGFIIERWEQSSGSWTSMTPLAANITSFMDTVSPAQLVAYRVCALGDTNSDYVYSNSVYVPTFSIPAAPSGVSCNPSGTSIYITFTDNSNDEIGFLVERAVHGSSSFYFDTILEPNTPGYFTSGNEGDSIQFRITAIGDWNSSPAYSDIVFVGDPPQTPSTGYASPSPDGVVIVWGGTYYSWRQDYVVVERSSDLGVTFNKITEVKDNSYTDSVPGQGPYYYRLYAQNAYGFTSNYLYISNPVSVYPPAVVSPSANFDIQSACIQIQWGLYAMGSYNNYSILIERSNDGTTFSSLATLPAGSVAYQDTNLEFPGPRKYRISTVLGSPASSLLTNELDLSSYYTPSIINTMTIGMTSARIDFIYSYVPLLAGDIIFEIQRSANSGTSWANVNLDDSPSISNGIAYDTHVAEATSNRYRIRAIFGNGGVSSWSEDNIHLVNTPPEAPTDLTTERLPGAIGLQWTNVSENYEKIEVTRIDNSQTNKEENKITQFNRPTNSYTDTTPSYGRSYSYSIIAISSSLVPSSPSNSIDQHSLSPAFVQRSGDVMSGMLTLDAAATGLTVTNLSDLKGNVTVGGNSLLKGNASINGNVGIGVPNPQAKLEVNGDVRCKDLKVTLEGFPDYVFAPDYKLADLKIVEECIKRDRHLPGIPSANTIAKDGMSLPQMASKQMEKIEELMLYVIKLNKEQEVLRGTCKDLLKQNMEMKQELESLKHR